MPQSNENKSCMRVEKREFAWKFSQLSCPGKTRIGVAWEFSQLMRVSSQTRARVWLFDRGLTHKVKLTPTIQAKFLHASPHTITSRSVYSINYNVTRVQPLTCVTSVMMSFNWPFNVLFSVSNFDVWCFNFCSSSSKWHL
jgi:hypothetical protein